jgi:hypothetical protein
MTNERKALLIEKMNAVFNAMLELKKVVTEDDIDWAEERYGTVEGDDEEIVMRLCNLRDDLDDYARDIV